MVGGASDGANVFEEDRGRFPRRPLHGQLQDLLYPQSKVADSFLCVVCVTVNCVFDTHTGDLSLGDILGDGEGVRE